MRQLTTVQPESHTIANRGKPSRKLLLLSTCFPPSQASGAQRVSRFYKYLSEFGYEVYVVTASPPAGYYPRVTFVPPRPRHLLEKVLRKVFFPTDEDILWIIPALRAAQHLMREQPMDAVLSTVPYVQVHIVALALKWRFGTPWIADYRDALSGNPFRTRRGIPELVDRFLDTLFFAGADLLIAVTDRVKKEWNERCPKATAKTAVIWNGYDPEEQIVPKPLPERPYRLISHFGNFYGCRTPVPLLSAVLRLAEQGTQEVGRFRLQFVGYLDPCILNAHGKLFEELIALGYLELVPPVPRSRALDMMMESDSLLLADNNEVDGHTVPAKLYEYIRIGRPILALTVHGSAVEQILGMSGVRFVTISEHLTPTEFDARLREFLQIPTDPVQPSRGFLREFNGREQTRKLAGLIDRMIDARARRLVSVSAGTDGSSSTGADRQRMHSGSDQGVARAVHYVVGKH